MATEYSGFEGPDRIVAKMDLPPFKTRRKKGNLPGTLDVGALDVGAFDVGQNPAVPEDDTGVICFTTGTAIRTPKGDVLIEDLRVGDLVTTMDNGPQEIRWIGRKELTQADLLAQPNLRPVLIPKGVLGAERDLRVSRQHGMLLSRDTLAQAIHLCGVYPGIRTDIEAQQVTYIHLMFDAHQIIFAENTPSESFYPGSLAMQMMGQGPRVEVLNLFPALRLLAANTAPDPVYSALARKFLRKREIKSAVSRVEGGNPSLGRGA